MKTEKGKTIGIVGGMGPQAGADLLHTITRLTPARCDQDHRNVILMSYPGQITDRTAYVEGRTKENPAYAIADVVLSLERAGAHVAGIACNSSHIPAIFNVISNQLLVRNSSICLLHMPDETCRYIREQHQGLRRVGVMSTMGTYKAGLYPERLQAYGLEAILPDIDFQHNVIHRMIYDRTHGIKSHTAFVSPRVYDWLEEALTYFADRGAEAVILGCTEFSLVIKQSVIKGMQVIDSNEALARALIRETDPESTALAEQQSDLTSL